MNIDRVIVECRKEFARIYGDTLKKVILYGSYARGTATEDSDIDLLIVLEGNIIPGKELDRIIDVITDINLKYGVLLSVYPISWENYMTVKSPLLLNIQKEGKAA